MIDFKKGSLVRVNKDFPYGEHGRTGVVEHVATGTDHGKPREWLRVRFDDDKEGEPAEWHRGYFDLIERDEHR